MTDKLYDKNRDVQALGDYWLKHLSAMTEEDLHSKSDIAAELAWRDKQIDELKLRLSAVVRSSLERSAEEAVKQVLAPLIAGVDLAGVDGTSTTAFVERYADGSYHPIGTVPKEKL